jgi:hypothetical protein
MGHENKRGKRTRTRAYNVDEGETRRRENSATEEKQQPEMHERDKRRKH